MKTLLITLTLLVLASCGKKDEMPSLPNCYTPMEELDGRDPMLVVGDSISLGYTPVLKELLPDMQVVHAPCNSMNTVNGVRHINKWVAHSPRWNVCTINHGLWDINPRYKVSLANYLSNLRTEIEVLKASCDTVMFMTTTQVNLNYSSKRKPKNVTAYNKAAVELMTELNVPVCDLKAVSDTISGHMVDSVHYNQAGSQVLGEAIKVCLGM